MAAATPASPTAPKKADDPKSGAKPEETAPASSGQKDPKEGVTADAAADANVPAAAAAVTPADEEKGAAAAAPGAASATASAPPTYAGTRSSEPYLRAKALLGEGDFDGALQVIETALRASMSRLPDPTDELHGSLAPLYYLYGTTLLYSVEESADGAESSVMVQQQQQEDEGGGGGGGEGGSSPPPADSAEDLQIAWENLDTARTIVGRIANPSDFARASSTEPVDAAGRDLVLDLAQIHLRLGDLQRANGNYESALPDYARALEVRESALGPYDRRVADTHYSLGMTCLALAVEGEKARQKGGGDTARAPAQTPAAAAAGGEEKSAGLTPDQIAEYKRRAIGHYFSCARSLGGIVGVMCGECPEDIVSPGDGKGEAGAQTPGSDRAKDPSDADSVSSSSSRALRDIRARVSSLRPTNPDDKDRVDDLREMLDEIQEAIDTAEEDVRGITDVSAMKARIEADIEAADRRAPGGGAEASRGGGAAGAGVGEEEAGGGITTVGFGAAKGAPTMTAAVTPPVMVVKKKKKRQAVGDVKEGGDTKRAKME